MAKFESVGQMASSISLLDRIAGCAAQEGIENPRMWVYDNAWEIVAYDTGWADAWAYAKDEETVNQNPDTGARVDVIDDAKILTVVQAMNPTPNPA